VFFFQILYSSLILASSGSKVASARGVGQHPAVSSGKGPEGGNLKPSKRREDPRKGSVLAQLAERAGAGRLAQQQRHSRHKKIRPAGRRAPSPLSAMAGMCFNLRESDGGTRQTFGGKVEAS
jgi:hypothetical protein